MAVASAWTRGHSAPVPHIRTSSHSSSPYDCSVSNKFVDLRLRFISGWNCTVPKRPVPKYGGKNSKRHLYCRCSSNNNNTTTSSSSSPYSLDWDWNRWTRHFSEIVQAETFYSILKFQLEDAIEKEDFLEAAKLKTAMAEATSKDSISEIMSKLKNAIDEERYHDASRLCTSTGSGLVGWWVGCSKDSDDPFGRLISVTPGVGRFVGKSFSPRQLVTASPGTPLFEIFVVKDGNETYNMQVVFLKRAKGSMEISTSSSSSKSTKEPSGEIENAPVVDIELNEDKTEKGDEKSINFEGATEEGIRSVINFLKEKIPELKVNVSEEVIEDIDSMKRLMEEDNENTVSSENSIDEAINLDDIQSDQVSLEGGSDALEDEKSLDMIKFSTDGVLLNKDEFTSKDAYMRVPGEIENMESDSFVLHVPMRIQDSDTDKSIMSDVKVAALAAQGASELMPPDVTKAFLASDKISPKVFRNVRDIVKLAVSQAQKKEKLSEYTSFSRIATSKGDLDPFEGLYVGAFGPYGTEVVQLRRKYGNWNDANDTEESSKVEFFEYVEAVKLTGDLNIPAGQLTFRAKIGQGNRLSYTGMYPDELGVAASYTGQGRIAEFRFRNPKWVDGELLQLSGKGMGPYVKGADLGFLYVVPEQTLLVLFSRLKLPE